MLLLSTFREKLLPVLGDDERAHHVVKECINSANCIAAIDDQKLVGLLGVRNNQGLFFRPTLKLMTTAYGLVGGLVRKACLALLEHATAPDEWYVFCVAVSEEARGQGIGSHLFVELEERAVQNGATKISLQVVNTNPRAEALYKRLGFVSHKRTTIWPLNRLAGWPFESAILMSKAIG